MFALSICLRPLALLAAAMHASAHEGSAEETVQPPPGSPAGLGRTRVRHMIQIQRIKRGDDAEQYNPNKHVDGAAG